MGEYFVKFLSVESVPLCSHFYIDSLQDPSTYFFFDEERVLLWQEKK